MGAAEGSTRIRYALHQGWHPVATNQVGSETFGENGPVVMPGIAGPASNEDQLLTTNIGDAMRHLAPDIVGTARRHCLHPDGTARLHHDQHSGASDRAVDLGSTAS